MGYFATVQSDRPRTASEALAEVCLETTSDFKIFISGRQAGSHVTRRLGGVESTFFPLDG